jgi:hypothetical protein
MHKGNEERVVTGACMYTPAVLDHTQIIKIESEEELLRFLRHIRSCPICRARASREQYLGAMWAVSDMVESEG